jgi:hypothetical protein
MAELKVRYWAGRADPPPFLGAQAFAPVKVSCPGERQIAAPPQGHS